MEVNRIGNIYGENKGTGFAGNVWDKNGLSPTITTMQGGMREPMIIDDIYNSREARVYEECSPTLRADRSGLKVAEASIPETVKIKNNNAKGYEECVVGGVADFSYPNSTTRRGSVQENGQVSPTLMAGEQDICRIENAKFCIGGLQEHQTPRTDGISPSLTAAMGMGGGQTPLINCQYRIRKLTPLECWRLMDFSDEDFCEAEQVNSNTQLYKQAGNSIVKNVLVAILGQMIDGKEDVYRKGE